MLRDWFLIPLIISIGVFAIFMLLTSWDIPTEPEDFNERHLDTQE